MHVKMTREHNLAPQVAAYALFSTDFASINAAMDFIFERDQSANPKMQHVYLPYVPEGAQDEESKQSEPYIDDSKANAEEENKDELADLELGDSFRNEFGVNEICFICQSDAKDHDPRR